MELHKLVEGRNNGFIFKMVEYRINYIPSRDEIIKKHKRGVFMLTGRDLHGRFVLVKRMVVR